MCPRHNHPGHGLGDLGHVLNVVHRHELGVQELDQDFRLTFFHRFIFDTQTVNPNLQNTRNLNKTSTLKLYGSESGDVTSILHAVDSFFACSVFYKAIHIVRVYLKENVFPNCTSPILIRTS